MGEGTITESSTTEQKIHVKLVVSGFQSGGVSGNSHWHRYSPRKGRVIGVLPWVLEGGKEEGDRMNICVRGGLININLIRREMKIINWRVNEECEKYLCGEYRSMDWCLG